MTNKPNFGPGVNGPLMYSDLSQTVKKTLVTTYKRKFSRRELLAMVRIPEGAEDVHVNIYEDLGEHLSYVSDKDVIEITWTTSTDLIS